jgi:Tfp pilus assembly protein PilP
MRRATATAAALSALVLAACGESSAEKAQDTVCDVRADISQQVDQLKGITPATLDTDEVSKSLSAIQSDLSDMKSAQSELSDDRRKQVESANQAFASEVKSVVKQIGTSVTAQDAASSVSSALQQLASSYEQAFSRVDCS